MKSLTIMSFTDKWNDVKSEVEKILDGPSAIVSKTTRLGFTTSASMRASEKKFRLLHVKPTNKINETLEKASDDFIPIYGHKRCQLLQDEEEDLLLELPLSLPGECPRGPGGCDKYPECDMTRAWFEKAAVESMSYQKLVTLAFSTVYNKDSEAARIRSQLNDVDIVLLDESHEISMDNVPAVEMGLGAVSRLPPEFEYLFDVQQKFMALRDMIREERAIELIEEIRKNSKLSEAYLTQWYPNENAINNETLTYAFCDLRKLARNRASFGIKDDDIRLLFNIVSLMSCNEITLNLVRTSHGDVWSIKGRPNNTSPTWRNAIRIFLRDVCPQAKVFFVSGTQFEKYPGMFQEIAGRPLANICMKDVKRNNSKMTIFPGKWSYSSTIMPGKNPHTGDTKRAKQEILDILVKHPGEPVYIICFNIMVYNRIKSIMKTVSLPEGSIIDYYRSPNSIGVSCEARIGIAIGIANTPLNSCDFCTSSFEESQSLRLQNIHAATWQAWSRIKDPEGKVDSVLYCIGVRANEVSDIIRQGSNRKVVSGKVTMDEELPRPNIMQEPKTKISLEPRKCSVDNYLGDRVSIDDRLKEALSSEKVCSCKKTQLFYIYYNICKKVGKICIYDTKAYLSDENLLEKNLVAFYSLILSRTDKIGLQDKEKKYNAKTQEYYNGYVVKAPEILLEDLIIKHLKGQETLALTPFDSSNECIWCAADFDDHKGDTSRIDDVKALTTLCAEKNIPYFVLRSGSHTGHHVWILLEPTDTYTAYKFIRQLIHDAPIPNKTEIEMFPKNKQANTKKGTVKGYGSQLKLPCAFNWKANKRSQFVDPVTLEPVDHIEITHVLRLRRVPDVIPTKTRVSECIAPHELIPSGEIRPCLLEAIEQQLTGGDGHQTRVAIAAEAIASGLEREEIIDLFRSQADFDYERSAYQVEFAINKQYKRWKCSTIKEMCGKYIDCANCPKILGVTA